MVKRSPTIPMSATSKIGASRILVDGDDGARVLDAGQVLDGAGDADGDIQLGRDDLAGLPHLHVARHVAGVDRGARRADGGAELVRQRVDELEGIAARERAAARDHLRCALQIRPIAAGGGTATRNACAWAGPRLARPFRRWRCRRTATASNEACESWRRSSCRGHFDRGDGIARVDRPAKARGAFDGHDVRDLRRIEQRGDARHQVLAEGGRRAEDVRERRCELGDLRRERGGERVFVRGVGHVEHARDAGDLRGLRRDGRTRRREHGDHDFAAGERGGGLHALGRGGVELAARVFGDDEYLAHTRPRLSSSANNSRGVLDHDAALAARRRLGLRAP